MSMYRLVVVWAIIATIVCVNLYNQNQELEKDIKMLKDELKLKDRVIENLKSYNEQLYNNLTKLKNEKSEAYWELYKLKSENEKLKSEIEDLKDTIEYLKRKLELYKQVPEGYYSANFFPEYPNTVDGLKKFISQLKIPHKYEKGIFDCSEISAFVEWALEDAGFDADIALGIRKTNDNRKGSHAWVVVNIGGSEYYVDFYTDSAFNIYLAVLRPNADKYTKIATFKDIFEAVDYYDNVKEWDWWNIIGFPPKISTF